VSLFFKFSNFKNSKYKEFTIRRLFLFNIR